MIRYKDKISEDYFIDPITAVITNSKGEIQKIKIKDGRPVFKSMEIHRIQVHTHLGYKKSLSIHHLDHNKMNNSLSNLVYLTHSEHAKIHGETRVLSEATKRKISAANKGENHPLYGKHHSEETKKKMSEATKGENNPMYGKHHSEEIKRKMSKVLKGRTSGEKNGMFGKKYKWINNGIEQRHIKLDEDIPEGFVKGMLKRKK